MKTLTIFFLLSFSALAENDSIGHLYLDAAPESVEKFLRIVNEEMPASFQVQATARGNGENNYRVFLIETGLESIVSDKQRLYLCIFNYLLKSNLGDYTIKLTQGNPNVLIANAKYKTIDIGDIEKFESVEKDTAFTYTAQTILIHELIEQFHLQNVQGAKTSKIKNSQLDKAHNFANQKEANYFNVMMKKVESWIYDEYIQVSFKSRVDNKVKFYYKINHKFGNITDIEKYAVN